jgi:cytoskeletal protein CcmA (bactofilin family)
MEFMSETKTVKQTIVENGTEFEGVVRSQCAIVVSGQVKGEVTAPTLTLKPEGSVSGKVKVSTLKSEGSLGGEIEADSVELSGSVSDDTVIKAASLEVKLSQSAGSKLRVSFGNCELQVGDPAAKVKPDAHSNKKEQANPELARVN